MLDLVLKQAGESEPGFARKTIKWAITCTSDGLYTGIVQLGEGKGRPFDHCPHLSQPELVGGGKKKPRSHYLADALSSVSLYFDEQTNTENREKDIAKHEWFLHLLRESARDAPYLEAAARMLSERDNLARIHMELKQVRAKPADLAVVRVDGVNPLERDDWHTWWRAFRAGLTRGARHRMRCVVTGECVEPAATHPKVVGLAAVGGDNKGDVLAGFDKDAFQSYGLKQSTNAAMSAATATAYTETLKHLIADKGIKLGNTLSVYWFTGQDTPPDEDNVMSWYTQPPEQTAGAAERRARELLTAIRAGQRPDLAGSRFVALLLSGASGRVMVREVMQGSFEELAAHTEDWFNHLAIVANYGQGLAPDPKFTSLAASLVRNDGKKSINEVLKEVPSPWLQQLWRAAITGGLIPSAALAQAVNRVRIDAIKSDRDGDPKERGLRNHQMQTRMALIKAHCIRNQGDRHMQPHMNPDHPQAAYHCGRALALFARLQRAALGDVGAGVVQRYYTAAAQTPGLILGRLASNAKNHLNKLDAGRAAWYEGQLADILGRIRDSVPRTLSLEEQSLFALGYYQQIAHFCPDKKDLPEGMADDASDNNQPE